MALLFANFGFLAFQAIFRKPQKNLICCLFTLSQKCLKTRSTIKLFLNILFVRQDATFQCTRREATQFCHEAAFNLIDNCHCQGNRSTYSVACIFRLLCFTCLLSRFSFGLTLSFDILPMLFILASPSFKGLIRNPTFTLFLKTLTKLNECFLGLFQAQTLVFTSFDIPHQLSQLSSSYCLNAFHLNTNAHELKSDSIFYYFLCPFDMNCCLYAQLHMFLYFTQFQNLSIIFQGGWQCKTFPQSISDAYLLASFSLHRQNCYLYHRCTTIQVYKYLSVFGSFFSGLMALCLHFYNFDSNQNSYLSSY